MKRPMTIGLPRSRARPALAGCASMGQGSPGGPGWAGAWGASPNPPPAGARAFENQTVRQVVRLLDRRIAGPRIRFTNEYGEKPLDIGAATLALAGADGRPAGKALDHHLQRGKDSVSIPPRRADAQRSDHARREGARSRFRSACSCQPQPAPAPAISPARRRRRSQRPATSPPLGFEPASTFTNRAFISAVEVATSSPRTIVTFGDSITDGTASSVDGDKRWPDVLARRLNAAGNAARHFQPGYRRQPRPLLPDADLRRERLSRFDRDVMSVPNAGWIVVLEGINDIGMGAASPPSADALINGYKQIIARGHAKGIKVYGATLLPYDGARYYRETSEPIRQAVNTWIRTSGGYDGVIDFDAVMRDPANPKKLKADLQSGDWLHPNDAGYQVMGDAVDLALFR